MKMQKENVLSVVFGHTVADALGVPVEFCTREELKQNPLKEMRGNGTYPVPAGSWSDDSSMSLASLDSLASGNVDLDDHMQKFVLWYIEGKYTPTGYPFDVGNTCALAIERYLFSKTPCTECGLSGEYDNGNGSLMRMYPFVLYAMAKGYDDSSFFELIRMASSITHAHPRSVIGCYIYAMILKEILAKPSKESIALGLKKAEAYLLSHGIVEGQDYLNEMPHFQRVFSENLPHMAEEEICSSGYVVETLEASLWCIFTTTSYETCVQKAVNLGDDTDTTAAVTGSIAGALYGYHAIPFRWLNALQKREWIEELCERAYMTFQSF